MSTETAPFASDPRLPRARARGWRVSACTRWNAHRPRRTRTRADPARSRGWRESYSESGIRIAGPMREIGEFEAPGRAHDEIDRRLDELGGGLAEAANDLSKQRQAARGMGRPARSDRPEGARCPDGGVYGAERKRRWKRVETPRGPPVKSPNHPRGPRTSGKGHRARRGPHGAELVAPSVQILARSPVGSGVLLPSESVLEPRSSRTYALTAWHVIRDLPANARRSLVLRPGDALRRGPPYVLRDGDRRQVTTRGSTSRSSS